MEPDTDDEWEYIELTGEQTLTLWKDVTVWKKSEASNLYYKSSNQLHGYPPSDNFTYYLRVKKES